MAGKANGGLYSPLFMLILIGSGIAYWIFSPAPPKPESLHKYTDIALVIVEGECSDAEFPIASRYTGYIKRTHYQFFEKGKEANREFVTGSLRHPMDKAAFIQYMKDRFTDKPTPAETITVTLDLKKFAASEWKITAAADRVKSGQDTETGEYRHISYSSKTDCHLREIERINCNDPSNDCRKRLGGLYAEQFPGKIDYGVK